MTEVISMLLIFREEKNLYNLVDAEIVPDSLNDRILIVVPQDTEDDSLTAYNDAVIRQVRQGLPMLTPFYQGASASQDDRAEAIIVDVNDRGELEIGDCLWVTVTETFECFDNSRDSMIGNVDEILNYVNGYKQLKCHKKYKNLKKAG